MNIIAELAGLVDIAEVEAVDRLLEAPEQEIACPDPLACARIARDFVVGHGQQLERIFALEPHGVQRRAPGHAVEVIGQALGQRKAPVIRKANQAFAEFDAVLRRIVNGDWLGTPDRLGHGPRSLLIFPA